jgi:hypothetical protein
LHPKLAGRLFDVIAAPYPGRTPRALADKQQVWERGSDIVLAARSGPERTGEHTASKPVPDPLPEEVAGSRLCIAM